MATTNTTDPQGWVTNPPQTIVKVQNVVSKPELNGRFGIVVEYNRDKQRYLLRLIPNTSPTPSLAEMAGRVPPRATSQQPEAVALRVDNLVKASYLESMQAQYLLLRHDPRVREQLQTYYSQFAASLPRPLTPVTAAAGVGIILIASMYYLGVSRTFVVASTLVLLGTMTAPDWFAQSNTATTDSLTVLKRVISNLPLRFRNLLREQVPFGYGNYIADRKILTAMAAAALAFIFVSALTSGSGRRVTVPSAAKHALSADRATLERYYKLGFEDASSQHAFGTSLPIVDLDLDDDDEDESWKASLLRNPVGSLSSSFGGSSNWSKMSTLFSGMYLVRTLASLGQEPGGGWNYQLALRNLQTLEPWKLGMMGLSVYRIVSVWMK
jgi:hypothetical protein